ncbi:cytochrome c [Pseudoxanthomonas sp.]|uniref:cytochrome c n=1 Tax=Pseudoxanthomonas sp. TaxID=1871049 RepID=UPI00262EDDF4|nr:cytochrome c [Pseudoxanthomonas sp.]WDS37698.1 MAG: cytochrome c [Pseudoxanthomonas sp.]
MFKRLLLILIGLVVVGFAGLLILAYRPAIAPIAPPSASSFPTERIARGKILAGLGDCAVCHTRKDGQTYAGGYPMETGFGTIYSSNLTPDPDTGIGHWSEAAFARAMRQGVARDGSHLFPAFPYDHFSLVNDEDIGDLYAYFMSLAPVKAATPPVDMPFPLSWRTLQAGWKLLFFHPKAYGPLTAPGKSPEWERGAYLAEGLGHCSACHSPRNALGGEKTGDARYSGAQIDRWYAPPLAATNPTPIPWTEDELYGYLRTGATALHGSSAGPMAPVIYEGLREAPDSDIRALAVYFADRFGTTGQQYTPDARLSKVMDSNKLGSAHQPRQGANLFNAACASCHYNSAAVPTLVRPELGLSSALNASDPSSLIQIILHGINIKEGVPDTMMPGFSRTLDDAQVAELASWLRSTRTSQPPWQDLEAQVAKLRTLPASAESQKSSQ